MTWLWRICFSGLWLMPAWCASVKGNVVLTDSRDPGVRHNKDFSGVVVWLEPTNGDPPGRVPPHHFRMVQKEKHFIAFSTPNPGAVGTQGRHQLTMLPNDSLDPIFLATVQATEEAVVNAMVAAETMTGINNHTVIALPHDRLREALKKYNRLSK